MPSALIWRLTGGASNSDPNASLGGARSSNAISGTAMNNLFDNVTAAEATAGDSEYRALDLYNSGDAASSGTELYMSTPTSSPSTELQFGLEASPINSTTSIANESTAPAAVSFANYTTGSRLTIPTIAAGSACRVWFKRVVSAGAPNTASDSGTFTVEYA